MPVQRQIGMHENTRVPESATSDQVGNSGADQFGLASLTNIIECHQYNKERLLNDLGLYHQGYNIRGNVYKLNRIVPHI